MTDKRRGKSDASELAVVRKALTDRLPVDERTAAAAQTVLELIAGVLKEIVVHGDATVEAQRLVEAAVFERARVKAVLKLTGGHGHDEAVRALAVQLRRRVETALHVKTAVVPAVVAAAEAGTLPVPRATVAHLKDLVNEETGVVELPLTEAEVADLLQAGLTFTEVSNGEDILIKVVDTTGLLAKLRGLYEDYRAHAPELS